MCQSLSSSEQVSLPPQKIAVSSSEDEVIALVNYLIGDGIVNRLQALNEDRILNRSRNSLYLCFLCHPSSLLFSSCRIFYYFWCTYVVVIEEV